MNAETAYHLVGNANAQEPYLSNMIRALTICSYSNTPEENARLAAAKWIKRNRKAYLLHCQTAREMRYFRA